MIQHKTTKYFSILVLLVTPHLEGLFGGRAGRGGRGGLSGFTTSFSGSTGLSIVVDVPPDVLLLLVEVFRRCWDRSVRLGE